MITQLCAKLAGAKRSAPLTLTRWRQRAPFLLPSVGWASGIAAGAATDTTLPPLVALLVSATIVALAGFVGLRAGGRWTTAVFFIPCALAFAWHIHRIHDHGEAPLVPVHAAVTGSVVTSTVGSWKNEAVIDIDHITSDRPPPHIGRLVVISQTPLPPAGETATITGTLAKPISPRNPGQFDRSSYLKSRGIRAELSVPRHLESTATTPPTNRSSLQSFAAKAILHNADNEPGAAVIRAMLLGDRSSLSADQLSVFRRAGVFHLFAVSGLHIGLLGALVTAFARLVRVPLKPSLIAAPVAMFLYALAVGSPPSAIRAATMGSLAIAAFLIDRRISITNLISIAALILLMSDTFLLFQPAFQFSFAALVGLIGIGGFLIKRITPLIDTDPFIPRRLITRPQRTCVASGRFIAGSICASIGAVIATSPLTLHYFNIVTPASICGNLLLWPITLTVIGCGLATAVASTLHISAIATLCTSVNLFLGSTAEQIATISADIPGGQFTPRANVPSVARITIYDIDHSAGCTLVEQPGNHTTLVGSGSHHVFAYTISRHLTSIGPPDLDQVILPHDGSAHSGAAFNPTSNVTRDVTFVSCASPLATSTLPDAHNLTLGDTLPCHHLSLDVLFPPDGFHASRQDDRQAITRLTAGPWSILFLESASFLATAEAIDSDTSRRSLQSDIVVVGWPGHDPPLTTALINRIQPQLIILRRPPVSIPQHVVEKTLARISSSSAQLIDMTHHGATVLEIDQTELSVNTHLSDERKTFTKSAIASDQSSSPGRATVVRSQ